MPRDDASAVQNTRRRHRHAAALHAERTRMDDVIDDVIDADDSEMQVASMLRSADLRNALDDHTVSPVADPRETAGPFAHIVVDEAQELTDAQWQMLISRCRHAVSQLSAIGHKRATGSPSRGPPGSDGSVAPHRGGRSCRSTTAPRSRSWPRPSR